MLPIISVGLTPAGRAVAERIPGYRGLTHYDTAESALWALGQENVTQETGTPRSPIELDPAGEKWICHVIYGDDAVGPLLAATEMTTVPVQVPVTGLVMVITDSLGDDQVKPLRVIDGSPESRQIAKHSVAAMKLLHAQAFLVVDQADLTPHWPQAIEHQLDRAEEIRPPVVPLANPGAEAAAERARLATLVAQGQHRPGLFENRDRR